MALSGDQSARGNLGAGVVDGRLELALGGAGMLLGGDQRLWAGAVLEALSETSMIGA